MLLLNHFAALRHQSTCAFIAKNRNWTRLFMTQTPFLRIVSNSDDPRFDTVMEAVPAPLSAMDSEASVMASESEDVAVCRATTSSMQSLLAHYFAEQAEQVAEPIIEPEPEPAVASLEQENKALKAQIAQLERKLLSAQEQADTDVLTPTLNRRAFLREVHRTMADCKRYNQDACIVYVDLDSFKAINDTYGHAAGDAALIHVSQTLMDSVREGDSVGRMGGDEFAILLRHADLSSARIKAMKLEAELTMGTFEHQGLYLKVGGSFGVRAFEGQATAESWVAEADASMFLSKKSSR